MNTLITYFSHDGEAYVSGDIVPLEVGNTCVAAEYAKIITGANSFRIVPQNAYPFDYKKTVEAARNELKDLARPKIKEPLPDISNYDTIILGYPNWCGTIPMIIATFLESYDFSGKTILPFCTNEGSGMGRSESDIKKLCPKSNVKNGLSIIGGQVKNSKPQIETWLKDNNII